VFWGMAISHHDTGTDNADCLVALCAITGHVGKPGAGLHPLRGQNNVQGASDMGLIPMFYPDYAKADDPGVRARFEQAWGTADLDPKKGLTVTEIIGSALAGGVRGMYMLGENPFLSDPNINKVRKALSKLDFLVVRDIFEEIVSVIPSYKNLTYHNLGLTGKLYPNPDPEHSDGTVVMFTEKFNTNDGLAHLVPAEWLPARELPDEEYPFVLNTGRMLE